MAERFRVFRVFRVFTAFRVQGFEFTIGVGIVLFIVPIQSWIVPRQLQGSE